MTIYLPLIVCLIGLITYAITDNPKAAELGRLAYWTGLLVTLATVAGKLI